MSVLQDIARLQLDGSEVQSVLSAPRQALCVLGLWIAGGLIGPAACAAQGTGTADNSIVVLIPAAKPPEREVYGLIRDTIASTLRDHHQRVDERPALDEPSPAAAGSALKGTRPRAVISLGRIGYQIARASEVNAPWVAGALQVQDTDARGPHPPTAAVSLTPDPRSLLEALMRLVPKVDRVLVPFNPERSATYIEAARTASRALKITLVALPAHDLREASALYYDILQSANPQTDALWISAGEGLVDLEGTLPSMVETAWSKRLVILSNVPEHARRGVLLSAYPAPLALGRHLADLAIDALEGRSTEKIQYGTDLVYVVNRRVASHLGLDTSPLTGNHHTVLVGEQ